MAAKKKTLNIGMVGYGFMARCHSHAWHEVANVFDTGYQPVLKAVAARTKDKAKAFADAWGYERVESDWRKLVEAPDIDAIDICVPNDLHMEIAIAAVSGWPVPPSGARGPRGRRNWCRAPGRERRAAGA